MALSHVTPLDKSKIAFTTGRPKSALRWLVENLATDMLLGGHYQKGSAPTVAHPKLWGPHKAVGGPQQAMGLIKNGTHSQATKSGTSQACNQHSTPNFPPPER